MHYHHYSRLTVDAYQRKRFGSGDPPGVGELYSYPSYLGVDIITMDRQSMPDGLLGFTDGERIAIRQMEPAVREFVLMHEEEHVKDMAAGEREIDERAFRRLLAKSPKDVGAVLALLEQRWKTIETFTAMMRCGDRRAA